MVKNICCNGRDRQKFFLHDRHAIGVGSATRVISTFEFQEHSGPVHS